MEHITLDLVPLAQQLVQAPSVTPCDAGICASLEPFLKKWGFDVTYFSFGEVTNLYARRGTQGPHLCFLGHTDVVPPGDAASWCVDPFAGVVQNGRLWGRGIADMKGAIAAFLCAAQDILPQNPPGSLSLLLTSDEEGPGCDGVRRVVPELKKRGEKIDLCLVGEPTGSCVGEMIKVGRRGSLTGTIVCEGTQGHIAYPHLADNPIPRFLDCLQELYHSVLDEGTPHFSPSRFEIVSIDVGNTVSNVIPEKITARFGVRFNPLHSSESLRAWIEQCCQKHLGQKHQVLIRVSGEPFLTTATDYIDLVARSVHEVTGTTPQKTTFGGTSDGRFVIQIAPVVECGLPDSTIHKADEHVAVEQLHRLKKVYVQILRNFFKLASI